MAKHEGNMNIPQDSRNNQKAALKQELSGMDFSLLVTKNPDERKKKADALKKRLTVLAKDVAKDDNTSNVVVSQKRGRDAA